jgi:hypothetical protein
VQSLQKAASELLHYCDAASTDEVAAFLTHLGGIGAGLHEMLQTEPNVGGVFRKFQHSTSMTVQAWWHPEAALTVTQAWLLLLLQPSLKYTVFQIQCFD